MRNLVLLALLFTVTFAVNPQRPFDYDPAASAGIFNVDFTIRTPENAFNSDTSSDKYTFVK